MAERDEHADNKLRGATVCRPSISDVHLEKADVSVTAGICNFKAVYQSPRWTAPITYSILVPTRNHRGVHMSRLVKAVQINHSNGYLEDSLRGICRQVNSSQPGCRVGCELEYPYRNQFMGIRIEMSEDGPIDYTFRCIGITACPCSKRIIDIGHMQRSTLKLRIVSETMMNFEEVALKMGECFSAVPEEFLKRTDEAEKILEAQANPRFVEDVVRECLKRFPNATSIEARSFESIHSHNSMAVWSREASNQRYV